MKSISRRESGKIGIRAYREPVSRRNRQVSIERDEDAYHRDRYISFLKEFEPELLRLKDIAAFRMIEARNFDCPVYAGLMGLLYKLNTLM